MGGVLWEFEHSVSCKAPREFAWTYWTNPANWHDPPARFEFDGPFAVGTWIKTIQPGQTLQSVIREVEEPGTGLIEMEIAGARVQFRWRFEELGAEQTRITQTLSLSGVAVSGLVEQARGLEQSVPAGMMKLADRIDEAWKRSRQRPPP